MFTFSELSRIKELGWHNLRAEETIMEEIKAVRGQTFSSHLSFFQVFMSITSVYMISAECV
jgi:hypothetical protein